MSCHLIMPMGGAGSRFYKNGFMIPKPLIEIHGKPFLYWSTMSIYYFVDIKDLTFVVLRQHIVENHIDDVIHEYFPEAIIKVIPEVLPGPVYTAIEGVKDIKDNLPIVFNDCDHMFSCNTMNKLLNYEDIGSTAALLTFESNEPQFSYVKYEKKRIIGTVEKQVVSNHAICGAYVFKNTEIFRKASMKYIESCPYNECFMSGIYNVICDEGYTVKDYLLDFHVEFGTPEEYEKAKTSRYFNSFEQEKVGVSCK